MRERVFIVGFRADTGLEWHFPKPTHSLDALSGISASSGEYWKRHDVRAPRKAVRIGLKMKELEDRDEPFPTKPWATVRDAIGSAGAPRDREASKDLEPRAQSRCARVSRAHR